jgi:hypothetical protein
MFSLVDTCIQDDWIEESKSRWNNIPISYAQYDGAFNLHVHSDYHIYMYILL